MLLVQMANTLFKRGPDGNGDRGRGRGEGIKPTLANRMQQLSARERGKGAREREIRKDYLPMQPDITRNTLALPQQMDG